MQALAYKGVAAARRKYSYLLSKRSILQGPGTVVIVGCGACVKARGNNSQRFIDFIIAAANVIGLVVEVNSVLGVAFLL